MGKNRQFVMVAALLVAVTACAYLKALGNGFVFDDKQYVLNNPHVQNGLSWPDVRWSFTSIYASNWHPLTWISLMIDNQIWGMNAFGYHLTNVLLHVANALLLFHLLRRMTGFLWRSAFVAALFAVHPLHVESVAWIAERKDVLSTLFWMLAMLAYARYAERPDIGRYMPVFVLLAIGLTAKPMLVSLPLMLLLMDYWPLRRSVSFFRLVLEKVPLFALSAGSCIITYLAQQTNGSVATNEFALGVRTASAAVAAVAYLWKMIFPVRLAAFYPHPGHTLPLWHVIGAAALLIGIAALVLANARRRRYLAFAWAWYLVTLVPVIGLLQVGLQGMADRYTYVPLIGIFVGATWWVAEAFCARSKDCVEGKDRSRKKVTPSRSPALIVPLVIVAACVAGTANQTGYWKDEISLCTHALAVTRNNPVMHNNLGVALYEQGDLDAAIAEYESAIEISSDYADVHINLGNALSDQGNAEEAIQEFHRAIEANPRDARAYNNLATTFGQLGLTDRAVDACRKAIELDPEIAAPHVNLAHALSLTGDLEEAAEEYRRAIELDPSDPQAHLKLGETLAALGETDEAIEEYSRALEIQSNSPEAHLAMGVAMISQARPDEAIAHYVAAIEARPDYGQAHHNLAIAFYARGEYPEAWREIDAARKCGIRPNPGFLEELRRAMPEP